MRRHSGSSSHKRAGSVDFRFLLAMARPDLDLAFAVIVDFHRMNAGNINQVGDEGRPSGRGPNLVKSEPHPRPACLMGRFNFIDVPSNLHAGRQDYSICGCEGLEGPSVKAISALRILRVEVILQPNYETRSR